LWGGRGRCARTRHLEGEFFALLGPSGCGKTTLLRLLAGFETADAGSIRLNGVELAPVPPHLRPVNMMFQSYALFPHLSVAGNVAFGLKQEGLPREEIAAQVEEMLALVKLAGFGARKPHHLQRRAPARRAARARSTARACRRAAGRARQEAARRDAVRADASRTGSASPS
jgi:putrescine transport system ATP-binding protein